MEKIKLTFLGTGSAVPTKKRNHPSILLTYKDENILIDCGEGTQRQFRYAGLNPCKITKILITHWHGDHVFGLAGLLQTLALNGYNKTIKVYGPQGTKKFMALFSQLFVKREEINLEVHEIEKTNFFDSEDFSLEAAEMQHETPALAYAFVIKEKNRLDRKKLKKLKLPNGPLIGELKQGKTISFNEKKIDGKKLLYKEEGRRVAIIMDTAINNECYKIAKDSNLLITEATYSKEDVDMAVDRAHLTSEDAANIAKKSKSQKLVLTHLSQRYESNPTKILKEAKKIFKNTILAEDLMTLEV
jgi:ribonuclease Z